MERTVARGRWASSRSVLLYIMDARAVLAQLRLTPEPKRLATYAHRLFSQSGRQEKRAGIQSEGF